MSARIAAFEFSDPKAYSRTLEAFESSPVQRLKAFLGFMSFISGWLWKKALSNTCSFPSFLKMNTLTTRLWRDSTSSKQYVSVNSSLDWFSKMD